MNMALTWMVEKDSIDDARTIVVLYNLAVLVKSGDDALGCVV